MLVAKVRRRIKSSCMILKSIKLQDADYLKGVAILLIMLHNYFHILDNAPGENEFTFSLQNTLNLLHNLSDMPWDAAGQFFSYFGHYGLPLFVFLSGYGLAKKYNYSIANYGGFIRSRFRKLYPVLFLAVVFLFTYKAAIYLFVPAKEINLIEFVKEAILKLTLLANFIPGQGFSISGPWWFFSLIFQLYLLAPLLLRVRSAKWLWAITLCGWLVQMAIVITAPVYIEYIRLNFLGHLPEFCLGILLARYQTITFRTWMVVLMLLLFAGSAFTPYLWVFSNSLAILLFIVAYNFRAPATESTTGRVIRFFGSNSLYFFTVHGLCRAPFVPAGNSSVPGSLIAAVLYLLVVVALTLVFKFLVKALTSMSLRPKATS